MAKNKCDRCAVTVKPPTSLVPWKQSLLCRPCLATVDPIAASCEACEDCKRLIQRTEVAHLLEGRIVCPDCHIRLMAEFDFRTTRWGMDLDEVVAAEGGDTPLMLENECVCFHKRKVGLFDAEVYYTFIAGRLARAMYFITVKHTLDSLYAGDFLAVQKVLREKYAKPLSSKVTWLDDLFEDDIGSAIVHGHLVHRDVWDSPRTTIAHSLTAQNYEVAHTLIYSSKSHAAALEAKSKAAAKHGF